MKITTYIGDDYADVTLTAADQEGLAVECNDEASAIALAACIADLLRLYTVEQVAVSTARDFTASPVSDSERASSTAPVS